jgi:hypothetical protein
VFGVLQHVEQTVHGSASKKDKAIDLTVTGLATLGALDPAVLAHPKAQDVIGKMNDAIIEAANVIATIQAAAQPPNADVHP